jgi:hypothetical protein
MLPKLEELVARGKRLRLEAEDQERTRARKGEIAEFYLDLIASDPSPETLPNIRNAYHLPSVQTLLNNNRAPITENMWDAKLVGIATEIRELQTITRRGLVDIAELSGCFPDLLKKDQSNKNEPLPLRTDEDNKVFLSRAIAIFESNEGILPETFTYPSMLHDDFVWIYAERFSPDGFKINDYAVKYAKAILKSLDIVEDVTREELNTSSFLCLRCPRKERLPMEWTELVCPGLPP